MTGGSPGGSVPQSLGDQTPFVMVPAFAEAASTSVAVKKTVVLPFVFNHLLGKKPSLAAISIYDN
jgi:hypothetical protein